MTIGATSRGRTRSYQLVERPRDDGGEKRGENLSYGYNGGPALAAGEAKRLAKNTGATLVGSKESGRFSHQMLKGEYRMVGQTLIVTIIDKHWLLPWPVVEVQLKKLTSSA
jgi:hypothetical protein